MLLEQMRENSQKKCQGNLLLLRKMDTS